MTDKPHLSETCVWHGFRFLSGSCEAELDLAVQAGLAAPEQMGSASQTWFSLSQSNVGDRVRITKLQRSNAGAELANAGITFGIEVQILKRTVSGSVVVRCNGRNIGVGAAIARRILVTKKER